MAKTFNDLCLFTIRGLKTPRDVLIMSLLIVVVVPGVGLLANMALEQAFSDRCDDVGIMGRMCHSHGWVMLTAVLGSVALQCSLLVNRLR